MPYIIPARRRTLDAFLKKIISEVGTAGEVSYCMTQIVLGYVRHHPQPGQLSKSYTTLALAYGILQATTTEFYRRVIAPYEDTKVKENGDVF